MTRLKFAESTVYFEDDVFELIREQKPDVSEQKLKWTLYELERDGVLNRIGTKKYIANLKKYTYSLRDAGKAVDQFISSRFPDVKYVIWESTQLNEWINFLLNQNTIFVDVEKELIDFVADALIAEFGNQYIILVNPDAETVARYGRNDLIIVKKLFSRSPLAKKGHQILLEKLMVDLLCDKCYSFMFDSGATEEVFAGIKQYYAIDTTKMFNYAKRRYISDLTKTLWGDESDQ